MNKNQIMLTKGLFEGENIVCQDPDWIPFRVPTGKMK